MQDRIRVLVADNNVKSRTTLVDGLRRCECIDVVGSAITGHELIHLTSNLAPDIIITEAILPHLDGLSAIKAILNAITPKRPTFFVVTAFSSDELMAEASAVGVNYFIRKPFDIPALIERVKRHKNPLHIPVETQDRPPDRELSIKMRVTRIMHEIGLPTRSRGYRYVRDAVLLSADGVETTGLLTKVLYPTIARKHGTTASSVERAIRHAIKIAWEHDETRVGQGMVGCAAPYFKSRPTNSELLSTITDRVHVEFSGSSWLEKSPRHNG